MDSEATLSRFRRDLLAWYDTHRRELPWRKDADPYRVWVSEIMLQQTRVAAVLDHYARFMWRFPTVAALAAAREQSVLAAWSGLGYYHRARRLHQAAKVILREHDGVFPSSAEKWIQLPGIGRYTAGAVASIACEEPIAAVDGNVERVIERLDGVAKRNGPTHARAQELLDRNRPGDFNQAMMELGATVCTPRAPKCLLCPVSAWCRTQGEQPRSAQPSRRNKQLCYAFVQKRRSVLLVQRSPDARLMAGMWELPQLSEAPDGQPIARLQHSITDTDYAILVYSSGEFKPPNSRWFSPKQWENLALTGLARKILRKVAADVL
jgi:A/G-specific adenine glycosylase